LLRLLPIETDLDLLAPELTVLLPLPPAGAFLPVLEEETEGPALLLVLTLLPFPGVAFLEDRDETG
jgi:hypothetical protein